ncbi:hypothetical protein GLAREA_10479 [Glarea lozoyensis ATCC 20868]|uniref:Uncharacterized protein n=1 Tax=Glarea lozoyensis (strain ATCC 20868 / MF5171) TaxID=1116229 RepID=S3DCK6_GLAL2|nr:uncharacterized protein GLAREA_10479 [Glarea lozoyensis ATCC 20868]EPE34784.1 hypothetical protein GLAREA_10479 [Glarea lozoyensis ATCC 20868]
MYLFFLVALAFSSLVWCFPQGSELSEDICYYLGPHKIDPGCESLYGCEDDTEVILCNDSNKQVFPDRKSIGKKMQAVLNQCTKDPSQSSLPYVDLVEQQQSPTACGENFEKDIPEQWNVIIRKFQSDILGYGADSVGDGVEN